MNGGEASSLSACALSPSSSSISEHCKEEKEDGYVDQKDRVLACVLACFGLLEASDNRTFCRNDMERLGTPARMEQMKPDLRIFYPPCKARVYVDQGFTYRRCITILKQILRRYGKTLLSRERNIQGRKTIYYQIIDRDRVENLRHMTKHEKDTI